MYSEVKMFHTLVLSDESLKIFLTKMIRWNKTKKKFLIMSSAIWIILTLGGSIHIYPEKRNDHKFGKKEIIDLFRKEMSYAQNSQHGASKISRGKSVKDWLYASSSCKGRGLLYHARIKLNVFNIGEKYSYN